MSYVFDFRTEVSTIHLPSNLNNPFSSHVPEIARIASEEFQEYITTESENWEHDFMDERGKMFGVLVVQKKDGSLSYLATISGKLMGKISCERFTPSVFDDATDDYFINSEMSALSVLSNRINSSSNQSEKDQLTEERRQKSMTLQQRLFENYHFLNLHGQQKNILEIFKDASLGNPPSGAGECSAPKLLTYAYKHQLKPIALTEFWWGYPPKNKTRKHRSFYPACTLKCRPILEYMLDNRELYNEASSQYPSS